MKTLRTIAILLTVVLSFSTCTKTTIEDDADKFVGVYSVSVVQNVTWGSSSGTLTDSGTIMITKISSNQVQVSGYFNTQGRVSGNNIYLNSTTESDSSGSITTVFGIGIYNGGVITLTGTSSGWLGSNGVQYTYSSTGRFTAIKQ